LPKIYHREGYFVTQKIKPVNIYSAPLQIYRAVLLLLRQRLGAAGSGLATMINYLRRTTSAAPRVCAASAGGVTTHQRCVKDASTPPESFGQRLELAEGTSPRELPYHCTDKAGKLPPRESQPTGHCQYASSFSLWDSRRRATSTSVFLMR
jgi:hypothetical protein